MGLPKRTAHVAPGRSDSKSAIDRNSITRNIQYDTRQRVTWSMGVQVCKVQSGPTGTCPEVPKRRLAAVGWSCWGVLSGESRLSLAACCASLEAALLRALDAASAAFRRADVPAVAAATARTQPARRGSLPARKAVRIAKVPSLDVFAFILSPRDLN